MMIDKSQYYKGDLPMLSRLTDEIKELAQSFASAEVILSLYGDAPANRDRRNRTESELYAAIDKQQSIIDKQRVKLDGATRQCVIWKAEVRMWQRELARRDAEIERLTKEAETSSALIKECLAALAEELSAWDIDPPIHHVKQAHDNCQKWLDRAAIASGSKTELEGGV